MANIQQYRELLAQARQHLLKTGWSHRRAAQYLERNPAHVSLVLCGRRKSQVLLQRLASLPPARLMNEVALGSKHNRTPVETQAENGVSVHAPPARCP